MNDKITVYSQVDNSVLEIITQDDMQILKEKFDILSNGKSLAKAHTIEERVDWINTFINLIEVNQNELAILITKEIGKPITEAYKEIEDSLLRLKYLTKNTLKWLSDETLSSTDNLTEIVSYEPFGVICNISAWNYPLIVGFNVFIPALLAGNSVMYKPSEYAILVGLKIHSYLIKAGVPDYFFQLAIGDINIGKALIELKFDGFYFTGSTKVGLEINKKLSDRVVFTQLELGGKDPLYITDEIENIDDVVSQAVDGCFYNNGQSCCAVKIIFLHKNVYASFTDKFIMKAKEITPINILDKRAKLGTLRIQQQYAILKDLLNDAVENGATISVGGDYFDDNHSFFQPTVLLNTDIETKINKLETFGPVVSIILVENDIEAVNLMQKSDFGLTASVFCSNKKRGISILKQMETGTVYLNCCDRVSDISPWSGRKLSGISPNHSYKVLRNFVQTKAYYINNNN